MHLKLYSKNLIILLTALIVNGFDYEFIPEDEKIFSPCSDKPGHNLNAMFDTENLTIEYDFDTLHWGGDVKIVWDVLPTDRIQLEIGALKWHRGAWQPTLFNTKSSDFCKIMYKSNEFWYDIFTQYVLEEDRMCVNNVGMVLHFRPFDVVLVFKDLPGKDLAGRYKMMMNFEAYDKQGKKNPNMVCFAAIGDIVKK